MPVSGVGLHTGCGLHRQGANGSPTRLGDALERQRFPGLGCTAMNELLGIVIFSGFMLVVVAALVGNVLLALYRERSQRKRGPEAPGGPAGE